MSNPISETVPFLEAVPEGFHVFGEFDAFDAKMNPIRVLAMLQRTVVAQEPGQDEKRVIPFREISVTLEAVSGRLRRSMTKEELRRRRLEQALKGIPMYE